jgi:ketosteroid isomerase-like protein
LGGDSRDKESKYVSVTVAAPTLQAPQQVSLAFAQAINASDLDAATYCFAKDACLLTPDATAIRGREEIRPILAQLIARGTRIEVKASSALVTGEVALGSERWSIRSAGAEGTVFEQSSCPVMVARLVEGTWKLAIAAPWGWGAWSG